MFIEELRKWCAKNGYVVLTYMRMCAYRVLDTRLDSDSTRSIAYRVLVSALIIMLLYVHGCSFTLYSTVLVLPCVRSCMHMYDVSVVIFSSSSFFSVQHADVVSKTDLRPIVVLVSPASPAAALPEDVAAAKKAGKLFQLEITLGDGQSSLDAARDNVLALLAEQFTLATRTQRIISGEHTQAASAHSEVAETPSPDSEQTTPNEQSQPSTTSQTT